MYRHILFAFAVAVALVVVCVIIASAVIDNHTAHKPLHNAYYPYSVETSIKDR